MSIFDALIRTTVNLVILPVEVVKDVVTLIPDGMELTDQGVGERTRKALQRIKDEAEDRDQ